MELNLFIRIHKIEVRGHGKRKSWMNFLKMHKFHVHMSSLWTLGIKGLSIEKYNRYSTSTH